MNKDELNKLIQLSDIFKEGFTIVFKDGAITQPFYKTGYIISFKTIITIKEGNTIFHNINQINPNGIIGGWFDKDTNTYYIEKNIYVDNKKEAIAIGIKLDQKEIFDIKNETCIKLPITPRLKQLALSKCKNNGV